MGFFRELMGAIRYSMKYLYAKDKSCKNCHYMMGCDFADIGKPYDERKKECTASCGNNMGMICEAWRPRMKGDEQ